MITATSILFRLRFTLATFGDVYVWDLASENRTLKHVLYGTSYEVKTTEVSFYLSLHVDFDSSDKLLKSVVGDAPKA